MTKETKNIDKELAQRYSNALLELANGNLTKDNILDQISDIQTSINNSEDIQKIIYSPVISKDEKKNLLEKIFSKTTHNIVLNFLKLLIDKNRFDIFDSIVYEYHNEINKEKGLLTLKVTSAIELNENEKAMVKVKLEKALNKELELGWDVNSDIMGGLVFEANDNIIDCSLQHKLQEIKKKMTV